MRETSNPPRNGERRETHKHNMLNDGHTDRGNTLMWGRRLARRQSGAPNSFCVVYCISEGSNGDGAG